MPRNRRQFLRTVGAVGTVSLGAGCLEGGSDPTTETDTLHDHTTDPGDPPTTTGGGAQAAFPDYDWAQLDGVEPTVATTVRMRGFAFEPLVATMPPGTEVTVVNEDGAEHTITVPVLDVDETIPGGGSASFTVERTGTFDYVCEFHGPGMLGRLVVEEGVGTPADTPTPTDGPGDGTATDDGGYY